MDTRAELEVELPSGVVSRPLQTHHDRRGSFTEIYRPDWGLPTVPEQWSSIVTTRGNVLRGVKVHLRHDHIVVVTTGRATFGLCDLRRGSPTERMGVTVDLSGDDVRGLVIPRGVAHGFYLHEPTTTMIADSSVYDPGDQTRVDWADPALGIQWPCEDPIQSDEDMSAPPLSEVVAQLEPFQPI